MVEDATQNYLVDGHGALEALVVTNVLCRSVCVFALKLLERRFHRRVQALEGITHNLGKLRLEIASGGRLKQLLVAFQRIVL